MKMEDKRKRLLQSAKSFRLTDRTAEEEKSLWLNSKKEIDSPAALT
jgi:hypothetical protein